MVQENILMVNSFKTCRIFFVCAKHHTNHVYLGFPYPSTKKKNEKKSKIFFFVISSKNVIEFHSYFSDGFMPWKNIVFLSFIEAKLF